MRFFLAVGCCIAQLAFAVTVGAAHVHGAANRSGESGAIHLDHTHIGESHSHGHAGHHRPAPPDDVDDGIDAHYLKVSTQGSLVAPVRVVFATIESAPTLDPPTLISVRRVERPQQLRGPPREIPIPPRAPPA
jgi:hypothetical protein